MSLRSVRRTGWSRLSLATLLRFPFRPCLVTGLALVGAACVGAYAAVPAGDELADSKGTFGPPSPWPIIAIHAVLLPDGRVMSYGTGEKGQQGAQLLYDIWNPAEGTDLSAHMVLPNTTATDIFCSAQTVIGASGEVFITGGDETIAGARNYSNDKTNIFDPAANDIRPAGAMAFPRWYPSAVTMANGEIAILGGRLTKTKSCAGEGLSLKCVRQPAATPEVFNPDGGWRTLSGATDNQLYLLNWFYPRAFLAPNGKVVVLAFPGQTYSLDTAGDGALALEPLPKITPTGPTYPSAMYAPGKILSLRYKSQVYSFDVNGDAPAAQRVANLPGVPTAASWSNMTVLADGKVLVNGGKGGYVTSNSLADAQYAAQIWDPAANSWTEAAKAQKARMYHSTALLLPDGSVLTAGGGAPGPVKNLNAEIYYPPYLYAQDGSGQPADRPTITDAPATAGVGESFTASVGEGAEVSRVTLVRTGSVTHSYNSDQRFLEADFTQSGETLSISLPSNPNVALPGYYMLFVFDGAGVPSTAKIVRVTG